MAKYPSYQLEVGEKGAARLAILNERLNPTSLSLLERAGLQPGFRVLDLGCGTGLLTKEIARVVGPSGYVLGVDYSSEQLELAQGSPPGESPLVFRQLDAYQLGGLEERFDIVFSRFLLMHLREPGSVLESIPKVLMEGGAFVSEEVGTYEMRMSSAYAPLLDSLRQIVQAKHEANGTGQEMGWRLGDMLKLAGFEVETTRVLFPELRKPREKQTLIYWLDEVEPFVLEKGIRTREQLSEMRASLTRLVQDTEGSVAMGEVVQHIARLRADS